MGGITNKWAVINRRKRVSYLLLQGVSVEEIAKEFSVSEQTIYEDAKKIHKEWSAAQTHNTDLIIAETLTEVELLKTTYWQAWKKSQMPSTANKKKVNQKAAKGKKNKKANTDSSDDSSQDSSNNDTTQSVEMSEEVRHRDGNPAFLKGIEWCINFKVELLGIKKLNINLSEDIEVEIEA